jgi:broad specificity phosphatase PhoE
MALSWVGYAQMTTFILVRHAEKDMTQSTNDPDLSDEGKARAVRLSQFLDKTELTVVYTTPFKRTSQTVEPTAKAKKLEVKTYTANEEKEIYAMLTQHAGGIVLVAGHSNTIPRFANYLLGYDKFSTFEDGDYGNLLVITVAERGKQVQVTWLTY